MASRWYPPESPIAVEFPEDLLGWIRASGLADRTKDESGGMLLGFRNESAVQIHAAAKDASEDDFIGIFSWRRRGEVFLTDEDLARFEEHQAQVALVIAGDRAGFFVREPNGSIQAVRSHKELVLEPAGEPRPWNIGPPPKYFWSSAFASLLLVAVTIPPLASMQRQPAPAKPSTHTIQSSSTPQDSATQELRDRIEALNKDAEKLREALSNSQTRTKILERRIAALVGVTPGR